MFLWKVIQMIFLGELTNEKWRELPDMHRWELIALAPLCILFLVFGVYPKPILDYINVGVENVLNLMS